MTSPRAPVLPRAGSQVPVPLGKAAVPPPGIDLAGDDGCAEGQRARFELFIMAVLGGGALMVATIVLFSWTELGTPAAVALLLVALAATVVSARQLAAMAARVQAAAWQRRMLERHLGKFVSPGVAEVILRGDRELGRAELREVTVLFCDLRDFTTMCERETPDDVLHLLNTFYERACEIVQAHGGTVNKFMGDGLLALFGAPADHPSPVRAAVESAHEMMYAADELRSRGGIWRQLDIGISLDTGEVVVGELGASNRAEYTAIGTTVNRAARLQGVSRDAHRRIVLSEDVAVRLGPRANLVRIGAVRLKGLSEPVEVFAFRHS